jgi:hypothetical protein
MKAMLWKELRENFKWAVLAMLGLGLAEFYGLMERTSSYDDQAATLCKSSFLMVTTFGCAAVGLVLGLIQILPEQRRDQWAALLHRPVNRATIFRGKALAGILLYLLATIMPFLACLWYAATPGHFATPFVPHMVLPGIADICAGAMYYFAALFVGLRRGAWYGTRAFGFLAAVVVSFFVAASVSFLASLAFAVFMALALFIAGWGTILTNGLLRDQPRLAQFALVTVVFFGVCGLGAIAAICVEMFSTPNYYYGAQYEIDIDGRPLKRTSSNNSGSTVTDLAGNPVHDKRFITGNSYNYLLSFAQISHYIGDPHQPKDERSVSVAQYRRNDTYVMTAGGSYDNDAERWYFLPQERYFVGYYYKINQRIGAIGQNGFRPGYEPVASLPETGPNMYWQIPQFVQFGSAVYHDDFDQRKLTSIFSEPGTEVFGAGPMESNQDRTLNTNWAAVALLDKMLVIDKSGKVIATLPYHQDMDRLGTLNIAVMPAKDRFFIYYRPSGWIDYKEQAKMPSYFEEMDAKGTLLNTYTLPPIHTAMGTLTWQEYATECVLPPGFLFGFIAYDKIGALCGSERLARELNDFLRDDWDSFKDISTRSSLTSFLLALLTLVWTRRMHFSWKRAVAWAAFVLAFNVAGLITFRLVTDWPVRVRCPQCNRKRPVEENLCPHCRAPWPTPISRGTEIYDAKVSVEPSQMGG